MPKFYVNKNAEFDGFHEVHVSDCAQGAAPEYQLDLGWYLTCKEAVVEAREIFEKVDGCAYCCEGCHTR
jgi:hypothetical protein